MIDLMPKVKLAEKAKAVNCICILLRDGRLFGPFNSRQDARYWAVAQGLDAHSTYDLINPRGTNA